MIEESKYCNDVMKKHLNKEPVMTKEDILKTLLDLESVIMIMLIMMLKQEVILVLLENIQALHIAIVISMLNQITKFLSYFTT